MAYRFRRCSPLLSHEAQPPEDPYAEHQRALSRRLRYDMHVVKFLSVNSEIAKTPILSYFHRTTPIQELKTLYFPFARRFL